MNSPSYTTPAFFDAAPAGRSLFETFLVIVLLTLLTSGAWSLFTSLPAYGGQSAQAPAPTYTVHQAGPNCFAHVREEATARTASFLTDVARGCPEDPAAYNPATLHLPGQPIALPIAGGDQ